MQHHLRRLTPLLLTIILLLAVIAAACTLELAQPGGPQPQGTPGPSVQVPDSVPQEFNKVWETWFALKSQHLNQANLDAEALSEGAVRGMLQALNDPYASYLEPREYSLQSAQFHGQFEGIGAEVTMRDGRLTIVAPLPDTPAERAGIRPGDVILAVDGESTEGMTLLEAITRIRGPKGTSVELLVQHAGQEEPVTITIVRDVIEIRSVYLETLPGDVVHLSIRGFLQNTDEEVREALAEVRRKQYSALVLDLRNNPGGLLDTVVSVTSQFLEGGLVLYEVDGGGQRKEWKVRSGGLATKIPMVVLVNQFSASGSEVLAGALQDHQRAKVVGVKTFGKGSVNTLYGLSDGSGIYFTIGRWYTPNGTLIEGEGLEPDIVVAQAQDSQEDLQLEKALEVLGVAASVRR